MFALSLPGIMHLLIRGQQVLQDIHGRVSQMGSRVNSTFSIQCAAVRLISGLAGCYQKISIWSILRGGLGASRGCSSSSSSSSFETWYYCPVQLAYFSHISHH
jgi:hypothetical protein